MSLFRKKPVRKIREVRIPETQPAILCDKCGSVVEVTFNSFPTNSSYCKKCWRISCDCVLVFHEYAAEQRYIWHYSIEEKGLKWFKMAREKLIKKLDKRILNSKNKEKRKTLKTIKKIEDWK